MLGSGQRLALGDGQRTEQLALIPHRNRVGDAVDRWQVAVHKRQRVRSVTARRPGGGLSQFIAHAQPDSGAVGGHAFGQHLRRSQRQVLAGIHARHLAAEF